MSKDLTTNFLLEQKMNRFQFICFLVTTVQATPQSKTTFILVHFTNNNKILFLVKVCNVYPVFVFVLLVVMVIN